MTSILIDPAFIQYLNRITQLIKTRAYLSKQKSHGVGLKGSSPEGGSFPSLYELCPLHIRPYVHPQFITDFTLHTSFELRLAIARSGDMSVIQQMMGITDRCARRSFTYRSLDMIAKLSIEKHGAHWVSFLNEYLCSGGTLKEIPGVFRPLLTYKLCLGAVNRRGCDLQSVPTKWKNVRMCMCALANDLYAAKFIPREHADFISKFHFSDFQL